MKKVTITVPIGNNTTNEIFSEREVSGEIVGDFIVHRSPDTSRRVWTVTHARSRFAAQVRIVGKRQAIWLAKRLSELGCWGFDNPQDARKIPIVDLIKIADLRKHAMAGTPEIHQPRGTE